VIRTAIVGGGPVGFLLGPLFAAAGLGRLLLLRRR
jgi:2-polyprenyl-6-methoxyphenol hydroxylase-like FAD-dependent oxidoreductase